MKKIFLFSVVLLLIFSQYLAQAQIQPSGNKYDSTGINVNVNNDLNDTLTSLPGTKAKMRLPKYFEPFSYEKIAGFLHKGTSTSIIAYEYPGVAFTAMTDKISDSTFTKQNAELLETFDLKLTRGGLARVYIMRFQTKTAPVIRIMYFTGDYQTTYYLMANIPEVVTKLIRNVILASFQTLEY